MLEHELYNMHAGMNAGWDAKRKAESIEKQIDAILKTIAKLEENVSDMQNILKSQEKRIQQMKNLVKSKGCVENDT